MKPKFFFAALVLSVLSFAAFAQKPAVSEPQTAVRFSESFSSVILESNIAVILTPGKSNEITIEGDAKLIEARVTDGALHLVTRGNVLPGTLTVYVPANDISKVYLNADGSLRTATALSNSKLHILLGAEARINVRSTGTVNVETVGDIDLVRGR